MENANLICFLASDDASYISGQNIQIDDCRKKQSRKIRKCSIPMQNPVKRAPAGI